MRSYSFQNSKKSDDIFNKQEKKKQKENDKQKKKAKTIEDNKEEVVKNNPINYIKEQEIILSQPVMLKNLDKNVSNNQSNY